MVKVTIETILKMLMKFNAVYDVKSDETAVEAWHEALEDLSDVDVRAAAKYLLKHFEGIKPKPVDVRKYVMGLYFPASYAAWEEALKKCSASRYNSSVEFSHPAIGEAVKRFGGASQIAALDNKDMGFARAQFRDIYNQILEDFNRRYNHALETNNNLLLGSDIALKLLGANDEKN